MTRQDFGNGLFEDDMQMPVQQESLESAYGIEHLNTAEATDDADISKLLHEAPAAVRDDLKQRLWAKRPCSGKPARKDPLKRR
ncbi:Myb superfamily proteins [Pseudomonas syringae pv. actinidiae]|uniref:Myb superfamily proteins n=1 Tax=Pseudomonas syringae pv. actinidiae TaxID=103796 RepID=A0A2V0QED3_PSESF|nr:Myb superfamily proteins [Pseudomonas syringae pv. actinidiae]